MAKRILLVGDLRNVLNYGAIATTESLISLIRIHHPDAELKCIDFRSMQNATPIDGWETVVEVQEKKNKLAHKFKRIRKFIVNILPYKLVCLYRLRKEKVQEREYIPFMNYHAPYLFKDYEKWSNNFLDGEILQYEKKLLDWADLVIVNGEGNVVRGIDSNGVYRHRTLYLFFISWLSKKIYNKPTYIVNHVVDPDSQDAIEIIKNLYPLLDKVVVRDPLSLQRLLDLGVKGAEYAPDALFSYKGDDEWSPSQNIKEQIDFKKPYILLGDSSSFCNAYSHSKWNVPYYMSQLVNQLRRIVPQIVFLDGFSGFNSEINIVVEHNHLGCISLQNCNWHELFHVMRRAEIFISGRWHASILSILAGTPILCWGSDSHKTKALYPIMDYQYKFFDSDTLPIHIDDIVREAKKIIDDKDEIREDFDNKINTLRQQSHKNITCVR